MALRRRAMGPSGKSAQTYLLITLLFLGTLNGLDGAALLLMLQDLKAEMHLSDTQIGVLSGVGVALVYSFIGIPIARWADHGNRVRLIFISLLSSGVMVVLCGTVASFSQLVLLRVGVGIGEAGLGPASFSLLADHFERADRPRAISLYVLAVPLSVIVGSVSGGWFIQSYGWRMTFVLIGAARTIAAFLPLAVLQEPRSLHARAKRKTEDTEQNTQIPNLMDALRALATNSTYRNLLICVVVIGFFGSGLTVWQPVYFARNFGLRGEELGLWVAVSSGLGNLIGMYLGGQLASGYAGEDESLQVRVATLAIAATGPIFLLAYSVPDPRFAIGLMALAAMLLCTIAGPFFALFQTLVPERMRALSIAIVNLLSNLIGSAGPVFAGAVSDTLNHQFGFQSVRYAMLILAPGYLWAAVHAWLAGRTVARDVDAVAVRAKGPGDAEACIVAETIG